MIDPTALRSTGNGLAPTITHPLNRHIAPSDTLISYQSFILSSDDECPYDTTDDAHSRDHIDEAYVAYASETNALPQLSLTSQRMLNDTARPGFFGNKNSLLDIPQYLVDPQSSRVPTPPLPLNARSIHAPPLTSHLPTTPIMLLHISPIPSPRLGPRTTYLLLLLLVQVLMLMLYLGLTTHHHYPRTPSPPIPLIHTSR